MIVEKLQELAEEARDAGDDNVSIVLYTLVVSIGTEDIGTLQLLAETCQRFSKRLLERLQNE